MKISILFVIVALSLNLLVGCDYPKSEKMSAEKKLELAEKCSKAGKEYFNDYVRTSGSQNYMWDEPEYHYSSKLNTCLIHIRHIDQLPGTKLSFQYNQVIDIFSNKVVLYGWFTRDVEKNTETLMDTSHPGIPNYTSIEYFKHKDKLFSE